MSYLTRATVCVAGQTIASSLFETEFNNFLTYINQLVHSDGSISMTGGLTISASSPSVTLDGTEVNGKKWRIRESGGYWYLQTYNTGTSTWDTLLSLPVEASDTYPISFTGGIFADSIRTDGLLRIKSGTDAFAIAADTTNHVLEIGRDEGSDAVAPDITISTADGSVEIPTLAVEDLEIGTSLIATQMVKFTDLKLYYYGSFPIVLPYAADEKTVAGSIVVATSFSLLTTPMVFCVCSTSGTHWKVAVSPVSSLGGLHIHYVAYTDTSTTSETVSVAVYGLQI